MVGVISCVDWCNYAIRVARMVHKPGGRAEFLAIDHIEVIIVFTVLCNYGAVESVVVKREEIRLILLVCILAGVSFSLANHLSKVDIDELTGDDRIGGAQA